MGSSITVVWCRLDLCCQRNPGFSNCKSSKSPSARGTGPPNVENPRNGSPQCLSLPVKRIRA
eukprot:3483126-Amphidinium_carterae.1